MQTRRVRACVCAHSVWLTRGVGAGFDDLVRAAANTFGCVGEAVEEGGHAAQTAREQLLKDLAIRRVPTREEATATQPHERASDAHARD
eukprot:6201483-Pleurochrysis_carterae.AAC.1